MEVATTQTPKVPLPHLPRQMTVSFSERDGRFHEIDRMINVVQSVEGSNQPSGSSFVQSMVNRHLWFTEPGSGSAERRVMVTRIDTKAPEVEAAYTAFYDALKAVRSLPRDNAPDDGTYIDIAWADGREEYYVFSMDNTDPAVVGVRDAVKALDRLIERFPRLPRSSA